ncbi:hypothetical protein LQ567_07070 [Niabella pedocola]|uniref:MotA/TolQ/ExbB proton channel domain-containing protein n=1 Tax=Niabella pedocola TaxID=1752077 RepID=A0ABS8PN24_9BACT|nr:hypothetical protein [Niabella pedocola]MCD2422519.1 hypothetical protein [Niabella pedocola]
MKILILPALLILLPIVVLFCILRYGKRPNGFSTGLKILLGVLFIAAGLLVTYFAFLLSMEGMSDKNIQCATGAVVFIPFGLLTYLAGVPLLLALSKRQVRS